MYLADLSEYTYLTARHRVFAVGWLDDRHPHPVDDWCQDDVDRLLELSENKRVHQMRGFHTCEICWQEPISMRWNGRNVLLGSAEVWVPSTTRPGCYYAAPDLIAHYIVAHRYAPPAEFLDSLRQMDLASFDPAACEE